MKSLGNTLKEVALIAVIGLYLVIAMLAAVALGAGFNLIPYVNFVTGQPEVYNTFGLCLNLVCLLVGGLGTWGYCLVAQDWHRRRTERDCQEAETMRICRSHDEEYERLVLEAEHDFFGMEPDGDDFGGIDHLRVSHRTPARPPAPDEVGTGVRLELGTPQQHVALNPELRTLYLGDPYQPQFRHQQSDYDYTDRLVDDQLSRQKEYDSHGAE